MTREDRQRWDEKWAARQANWQANPLLVRFGEHLTGGDALDLACGAGQNALWLAGHGYRVLGLDISRVALARARVEAQERGLEVYFVQADLDRYGLPQGTFDLVTVFRFLDRSLFPAIQEALRSSGWLFYQTYNVRRLEAQPDTAREYLVELGELQHSFEHLELVEGEDVGDLSHVVCRRR